MRPIFRNFCTSRGSYVWLLDEVMRAQWIIKILCMAGEREDRGKSRTEIPRRQRANPSGFNINQFLYQDLISVTESHQSPVCANVPAPSRSCEGI